MPICRAIVEKRAEGWFVKLVGPDSEVVRKSLKSIDKDHQLHRADDGTYSIFHGDEELEHGLTEEEGQAAYERYEAEEHGKAVADVVRSWNLTWKLVFEGHEPTAKMHVKTWEAKGKKNTYQVHETELGDNILHVNGKFVASYNTSFWAKWAADEIEEGKKIGKAIDEEDRRDLYEAEEHGVEKSADRKDAINQATQMLREAGYSPKVSFWTNGGGSIVVSGVKGSSHPKPETVEFRFDPSGRVESSKYAYLLPDDLDMRIPELKAIDEEEGRDMYEAEEHGKAVGESTEKTSRHSTWEEAHATAQKLADQTGQDVAIRRVREYGKDGFNVSYASRNDSDYARAEIVKPSKYKAIDEEDHRDDQLMERRKEVDDDRVEKAHPGSGMTKEEYHAARMKDPDTFGTAEETYGEKIVFRYAQAKLAQETIDHARSQKHEVVRLPPQSAKEKPRYIIALKHEHLPPAKNKDVDDDRVEKDYPYDEGKGYGMHGQPQDANPYALGSIDHGQWDQGWQDGKEGKNVDDDRVEKLEESKAEKRYGTTKDSRGIWWVVDYQKGERVRGPFVYGQNAREKAKELNDEDAGEHTKGAHFHDGNWWVVNYNTGEEYGPFASDEEAEAELDRRGLPKSVRSDVGKVRVAVGPHRGKVGVVEDESLPGVKPPSYYVRFDDGETAWVEQVDAEKLKVHAGGAAHPGGGAAGTGGRTGAPGSQTGPGTGGGGMTGTGQLDTGSRGTVLVGGGWGYGGGYYACDEEGNRVWVGPGPLPEGTHRCSVGKAIPPGSMTQIDPKDYPENWPYHFRGGKWFYKDKKGRRQGPFDSEYLAMRHQIETGRPLGYSQWVDYGKSLGTPPYAAELVSGEWTVTDSTGGVVGHFDTERDAKLAANAMVQLAIKEMELHRRETSQGTSHDVRKMNRLREEIALLKERLNRLTQNKSVAASGSAADPAAVCGNVWYNVRGESGRPHREWWNS